MQNFIGDILFHLIMETMKHVLFDYFTVVPKKHLELFIHFFYRINNVLI